MHWPDDLWGKQQKLRLSTELEINYLELGKGQTLLFIHNSGGFWQIWLKQIRYFAQTYRVIAIDLPQNGQSSNVKEDITLSYFTNILDQFILQKQLSDLILIGNCIGASISLNYSLLNAEKIKQLILFNICPGRRLVHNFFAQTFLIALAKSKRLRRATYPLLRYIREQSYYKNRFPRILFGRNFLTKDPLFLYFYKHLATFDGRKDRFKDLYALDSFSLKHYYHLKLKRPLLLFWGEDSQATALDKDGQYFAKILGATLTKVPKAGHLCMYEQSSFVNHEIEKFIK